MFALSELRSTDLVQRFIAIKQCTRAELGQRPHSMSPEWFEAPTGELLIALGFGEGAARLGSVSS
jgi:hypothetical protein